MRQLRVDKDKTIQAIVYVADRLPELNRTTYFVLKMFYYADKLHLERYGRQITGDDYIAMQHGPVPSFAYDIIKYVRTGETMAGAEHAANVFAAQGNKIKSIAKPNQELFSDSEIECFDEAIRTYGDWSFGQIKKDTHDNAWRSADENDSIDLIEIAKLLPNATELVAHLTEPYPD